MTKIAIPDRMNQIEAARYLKMSPSTLPGWRGDGKGPPYTKLGGRILYSKTDLDTWVASQRVDPAAVATDA